MHNKLLLFLFIVIRFIIVFPIYLSNLFDLLMVFVTRPSI